MTKNVIFVNPKTKVTEVAGILFKNRFHGLPVVEDGKIVGIITEDDFYIKDTDNIFLPSYINFLKETKVVDDLPKDKKEDIQKLLNANASDIMTPDCLTVSLDMELDELLALIKKTKFNTLPVSNSKKELLGIVTLMDVVGLINRSANLSNIPENMGKASPREVDELTQDVHSFWKRTFVLIKKTNVKTWKAIFIIAFIAGIAAALVWNISIKVKRPITNNANYQQF